AGMSRTRPVQAERIDCRAGPPDPADFACSDKSTAAGSGDPALQPCDFGCPTWIVDGTPSDSVNIAVGHLLPRTLPIDAVISGINVALNASLGLILASGTIGRAWA